MAKQSKRKDSDSPDKEQKAAAPAKHPGGRPTNFKPEFVEQGKKLAQLGATDREIAEFFEVSENTLHRWKHTHPEFRESLKVGKDTADDRVEQSLYRRACGYSHDAVKIFMPAGAEQAVYAPFVEHVAPDTTACIFWLKNRRKAEWPDKLDHEHGGPDGGPIKVGMVRLVPLTALESE